MTLEELNAAPAEWARTALLECCGSRAWTAEMAVRRPYPDLAALERVAQGVWLSIGKADWLEAFAAHPKIGEKKPEGTWSESEQSGMARASETTAATIERLNREYEAKFGWIFIVCATGKTGEEMLEALRTRLENDPQSEIEIAAAEQMKITQLRLRKLITE